MGRTIPLPGSQGASPIQIHNVTELAVERLQQALVVRQAHLFQDELDTVATVSQLAAQLLGQVQQEVGVAIRAGQVNLDLVGFSPAEGLDCHMVIPYHSRGRFARVGGN